MLSISERVPIRGNFSQFLPAGVDVGNGVTKLAIDGQEVREPS